VVKVLRAFRLLRVFKLAKVWKSFNYILVTIGNTISKISAFMLLLYLFIFIYTILGMQLFAYEVSFDDSNVPIENAFADPSNIKGTQPWWNFDNFLDSSLSVFIVLANDGWTSIYFDY
jgi:voltage-dependent calcium channel L type alpha-1D